MLTFMAVLTMNGKLKETENMPLNAQFTGTVELEAVKVEALVPRYLSNAIIVFLSFESGGVEPVAAISSSTLFCNLISTEQILYLQAALSHLKADFFASRSCLFSS